MIVATPLPPKARTAAATAKITRSIVTKDIFQDTSKSISKFI